MVEPKIQTWRSDVDNAPRDGTLVDLLFSTGREATQVIWRSDDDVEGWVNVAGNYVRGEDEDVICWRPWHSPLGASSPNPVAAGTEGEPVAWRCDECGCQTYARVDELKANGRFGPGDQVRCVNCKRVSSFPTPTPGGVTVPEGMVTAVEAAYREGHSIACSGLCSLVTQDDDWRDSDARKRALALSPSVEEGRK